LTDIGDDRTNDYDKSGKLNGSKLRVEAAMADGPVESAAMGREAQIDASVER
jgi:hypothetical protein